ncbi:hypothetical protein FXO38_29730 [Capsicum annuum]|nr:hypothetical protein FXO38_29730 [Capsicum annuum]KAF3637024.1 hypothetical protein FXO37_25131 [Capsicum annuum]
MKLTQTDSLVAIFCIALFLLGAKEEVVLSEGKMADLLLSAITNTCDDVDASKWSPLLKTCVLNIDHAMSNDMMDLSNVRVLLCDTDVESCHEVLALLKKCCYQVIPVCSAADALDALNSQGHCIDIVLAEASLLISNGAKIFNFIKLDVNIKHIPVIMMLDEDEIPLVLKGLMLGATDYLVKPLSSNELMKLWTHTKRKGSQLVY